MSTAVEVSWVNELKAKQNADGSWCCEIRTVLGELLFVAFGNDANTAEERAYKMVRLSQPTDDECKELRERNRALEEQLNAALKRPIIPVNKPPPFTLYGSTGDWPLSDADGYQFIITHMRRVSQSLMLGKTREDGYNIREFLKVNSPIVTGVFKSWLRNKEVYVIRCHDVYHVFSQGTP